MTSNCLCSYFNFALMITASALMIAAFPLKEYYSTFISITLALRLLMMLLCYVIIIFRFIISYITSSRVVPYPSSAWFLFFDCVVIIFGGVSPFNAFLRVAAPAMAVWDRVCAPASISEKSNRIVEL